MGKIVLYSLLAAVYPTLIAVTTVMLLLPKPEHLMFGFWFGSMLTSVTCGLVIVFTLQGTGVDKTSRHTASPAVDLAISGLLVLAALGLAKGVDKHLRARHETRKARHSRAQNKPPKWQQKLGAGNLWQTFVVGVVLSFPGVWYLAALDRLPKLHYATVTEILVVIGFCLVQLTLIEVPMLAFRVWPTGTPIAIDNAKAWASKHGRQYGIWGLVIIAGLLLIRGLIGLLA